ncbi:MAG TPA: type II toxin-antitoxin system VapB family antitoxin [Micromonosporaceae bacterium]|nr:type II toxin-antitoxin system VapB family antitoxin [Micromonosporaceae bacterium]
MARTMIDVDEELLAEAARLLGTRTKKETVNTALREVGERLRRLEALVESQEMVDRGEVAWDRWEQEWTKTKSAGAGSDPPRAVA